MAANLDDVVELLKKTVEGNDQILSAMIAAAQGPTKPTTPQQGSLGQRLARGGTGGGPSLRGVAKGFATGGKAGAAKAFAKGGGAAGMVAGAVATAITKVLDARTSGVNRTGGLESTAVANARADFEGKSAAAQLLKPLDEQKARFRLNVRQQLDPQLQAIGGAESQTNSQISQLVQLSGSNIGKDATEELFNFNLGMQKAQVSQRKLTKQVAGAAEVNALQNVNLVSALINS